MNFVSLRAVHIFLHRNVRLDWLWGAKQLLSTECGKLSQRVKRPGCKAHQLPLASAVGKNVCNFTSVITLVTGLLSRGQGPEGPATGHLDAGFSWFSCVHEQMLRWYTRCQIATTCLSCSPPDLNLVVNPVYM